MGFFVVYPIQHFMTEYGLDTFVETGTFIGSGVACARYFDFKEIYSIEISPKLAQDATEMFHIDTRVKILQGHSPEVLDDLLPKLAGRKILFWLDSHFPDKYDQTIEPTSLEVITPLAKELEVIRKHRHNQDMIIIDDARIYEEGEYDSGNYEKQHLFANPNLFKDFKNTHGVNKRYDNEGYFLLYPKQL